MAYVASATHID